MKTHLIRGVAFLIALILWGCEDFLSIKQDQTMAVPHTGADLQALLDYALLANNEYTGLGEIATDDYYLEDAIWASLTVQYKEYYGWEKVPVNVLHWRSTYNKVTHFNTVIDLIDEVSYDNSSIERDQLLGAAVFFRAYAFYMLTQVFTKPYDPIKAETQPGVVLRLTADVNAESTRSTLEDTYGQIIKDLNTAVALLSLDKQRYPTRPTKQAAYGMLARLYLSMGNYEQAGLYADSCLKMGYEMMDFNSLPKNTPYPFERFNSEVIFFSTILGDVNLVPSRAKVDSVLFDMYMPDDLRKQLFFTLNTDGSYFFSGNFNPVNSSTLFNGITSAEVLLIRAECNARQNNLNGAWQDLNEIMKHRFANEHVINGLNQDETVRFILDERRRELAFRGLRWEDIRRLAADDRYAVTLVRIVDGQEIKLTPADQLDFAFLIPLEVIELTGIKQN
ncbi:SusD family protein [Parapedobacter indicus]|uniref:SusD family protein n=2 Tax=Parapedobacter indicus TaxID=1477437 RepID=A0A1I3TJ19_9SPHI|nr:SusD-like starch-binding protein associating with outer membrane [Parapedobacter indicus]SFJ69611.1 SusD family protein [Parapedobacter indicus]